jgi:hypothetical protein
VVPVKDRGKYVGLVVFTILPFCPSVLYAQMIAQSSSWRYNGLLVGVWNFVGLLLVIFAYKDPSRLTAEYTARHVLRQVDYIGGILSTVGVTCFMMGLQWGASQVSHGLDQTKFPLTRNSIHGEVHTTLPLFLSALSSSYPSSSGSCTHHTLWCRGHYSAKLRRR